jgi:hypothetical protein
VELNLPVLQQNLMGDKLYGFTPDWENFIIGSQWAAKNLDKDAVIISRKPTISKVYTGRDFDVVPTALTVPPDTLTAFGSRLPKGYTVAVIDASMGVFPGEGVQYVVSHLRGNKFSLHGTETRSVCIYLVPDEYLPDMMLSVGANEMAYTLDFDEFFNQLDNIESYRIYDPDMMLRYLEEHNIKYLLLPQLRVYPSMKSDQFINNVHQYRDFISFKRPGHFRTIHTVGNDEPCEIVEFIR